MPESGIPCPRCGTPATGVTDTRKRPGYIKRRRECPVCGLRVTTEERPVAGSWRSGPDPLDSWRAAAAERVVSVFGGIGP